MNIIEFGAIGGTGWTVIVEALVAGHIVTAFAHDANKIALAENLIVVKGDVMNAVDIAPVLVGQDAVVVSFGNSQNPFAMLLGARRTALNGPS